MLKALGETIGTAGSGEFYASMARYLRHCMDFDNIIVILYNGTERPVVAYSWIRGPDVFRYLERDYLPAAYILDPVYHFHLNQRRPGIYRLLDIAPDNFRRSRYFKWYYGRIGIIDEISVVLPVEDNTTITISMGRDGSSGQHFSARDEEGLRAHEPVIMPLLKKHWQAQEQPERQRLDSASIVDSLIAAMRTHKNVTLTRRQAEVALLILQGHSSPSIGLHLGISTQTVKVFRKQLYRKCNISSQAELFSLMMPMLERQRT